ncbi:MAG: hypothetical protein KDA92_21195 [Planctomycetales bacterium]|nr:hypothetical protein [Planctomycetales bacterium]
MNAMINRTANGPHPVSLAAQQKMTKGELLDAIWSCEAVYRDGVDPQRDHRQFLSRDELVTVYTLVQRRAELRSESNG